MRACALPPRELNAADIGDAAPCRYLVRLLYLLLRADDRPTAQTMLSAVSPLLATVLDHERESSYLEAMASGKYQPELLFPKQPEIVERIRQHPALIWKAHNVAEHLHQLKKRP